MSLSPYFPELILREGFFFFFDGGSHSFREMPYSFPPLPREGRIIRPTK